MDAPWCSKVGILVSFRHDVILWRLRENLGERQRNVGKRLHGNRSGPSDAAESRGGPGPAILLPRGVVRAVSPGRWEELREQPLCYAANRAFVLPTRHPRQHLVDETGGAFGHPPPPPTLTEAPSLAGEGTKRLKGQSAGPGRCRSSREIKALAEEVVI